MTRTDVNRRSNPSEPVRGTGPRPASFTQIREGSVDQILVRILIALFVFPLFAAACGGSGDDTETGAPNFVVQGEQTLDDEITTTTEAPADFGATGASEAGGEAPAFDETSDTIPDGEEETPEGEFFDAVGVFMQCLNVSGFGFLGIPNDDPENPANDEGYRDALSDCAARSEIVSKMTAAEDTSRFSAEEIEERNRGFVEFTDCLKGRGWKTPSLSPDENGSIIPGYAEMAQAFEGPDGSGLIDGQVNDDFADCGAGDAFTNNNNNDEDEG